MQVNEITDGVIGAAIEVHRALGPGLLESAYVQCLCHELHVRNLPFRRELSLPVNYKGLKTRLRISCGHVGGGHRYGGGKSSGASGACP